MYTVSQLKPGPNSNQFKYNIAETYTILITLIIIRAVELTRYLTR